MTEFDQAARVGFAESGSVCEGRKLTTINQEEGTI